MMATIAGMGAIGETRLAIMAALIMDSATMAAAFTEADGKAAFFGTTPLYGMWMPQLFIIPML